MNLSMKNFMTFRNLVYDRCGINFESKKIYFVKKRLISRMEALEIATVEDYLRYLKFRDPKRTEFQELLNLLTTNETYMVCGMLHRGGGLHPGHYSHGNARAIE